jgi:hypothetical protein
MAGSNIFPVVIANDLHNKRPAAQKFNASSSYTVNKWLKSVQNDRTVDLYYIPHRPYCCVCWRLNCRVDEEVTNFLSSLFVCTIESQIAKIRRRNISQRSMLDVRPSSVDCLNVELDRSLLWQFSIINDQPATHAWSRLLGIDEQQPRCAGRYTFNKSSCDVVVL